MTEYSAVDLRGLRENLDYLKRFGTIMSRLVCAPPSPPPAHWPSFLLHFCVFYFFDFIEVVGPGLHGLHVATPVTYIYI